MRFMILIKASPASEAGQLPDASVLAAMARYNEELVKAGVLLAAEGLLPSASGTRIEWRAGKKTVTDGPFAESKELIAGFWLLQVKSPEEALAWANRVPNPLNQDARLELRRVGELDDLLADRNGAPPAA
jgi:hypothetical protein